MITAAPVACPGAGRNGVRVGLATFCTTGTLSALDMDQVSGGAEAGGSGAFSAIAPGGALGGAMSIRRAWAAAGPAPDRSRAADSRPAVNNVRVSMCVPRCLRPT